MIKLEVNGEPMAIDPMALSGLLTQLNQQQPGVAVAVNSRIVPRTQWAQTPLNDGDSVDIFSVIAGG
ncbi:sulfur carrier protein ThiS [Ferrimonas sediminum]|uniref:Sulfur carrier protein ThiS n=1 Tax=Ferrimonas sediminum TaxID=718193 RepID=A0A1G8VIG1_9GAMM|nr:sulfur carrier protein ThiS [Ferrimonas sediminum]SDJ65828.1 sulfur carrier protein ThiS [Ferrimonas sediminum]